MKSLWMLGAVLVLAGCGGGGGGGGGGMMLPVVPPSNNPGGTQTQPSEPSTSTQPDIVPVSTVAGRCAAPRRTGGYFDRQGTVADEKRWVRSWIDQSYLWYDEVPNLRSADYATPVAYFHDLKTPALTPSGRPKDRFHYTVDTAELDAMATTGATVGYGIAFAYLQTTMPRDLRVAYVEPGSPAANAGVTRGQQLVAIDGVDVVNGGDATWLNARLAPKTSGQKYTFQFKDLAGDRRDYALTAGAVKQSPVQNVKVLQRPNGRVGYMQFNAHQALAETPLMDAIDRFKQEGVAELVIDMRYNGGGLLGVANALAYMVAPDSATRDKVFEKLRFNRKNPFGFTEAQTELRFATKAAYGDRAGQPLPQLGLSRVIVLSGPDTCSASESLVNGLRGVDVQVDLVGAATCGKPYGFLPTDNCGVTYHAAQFQGVNAKGYGDYVDGMAPTCAVPDDFSNALGDEKEGRLKVALGLIDGQACPAVNAAQALMAATAKGRLAAPAADMALPEPMLRQAPWSTNRILDLKELIH